MHTARYSWPFEFNDIHEPEMKNLHSKKLILFALFMNLGFLVYSQELNLKQINEYRHTEKTFPVSVALKYPIPKQSVENDEELNVMADILYQCSFII